MGGKVAPKSSRMAPGRREVVTKPTRWNETRVQLKPERQTSNGRKRQRQAATANANRQWPRIATPVKGRLEEAKQHLCGIILGAPGSQTNIYGDKYWAYSGLCFFGLLVRQALKRTHKPWNVNYNMFRILGSLGSLRPGMSACCTIYYYLLYYFLFAVLLCVNSCTISHDLL